MSCLQFTNKEINGEINLPSSKSISNRLLILNEVLDKPLQLHNLSEAEDTDVLQKCLQKIKSNTTAIIDVGPAGTNFRFLTALLSVTEGRWMLTGSERIRKRPISELVNALQTLGADISYTEQENYAPLLIKGKKLTGGEVSMNASISSQFMSALLMVAPSMEKGITLHLQGNVVSLPYLEMTIQFMRTMGLEIEYSNSQIRLHPQNHKIIPQVFTVESDWSAASYWYAFIALSHSGRLKLNGLQKNSLQGDSVLEKLFSDFGVKTIFENETVVLEKQKTNLPTYFEFDFTDYPDIAQTMMVVCYALNIEARFTGLSTLKGKETNRLLAMQNEFRKLQVETEITPDTFFLPKTNANYFPEQVIFDTYHDHRMAMCFAPLSMLLPKICFHDSEVVKKSYPHFWEDIKRVIK
jgi:3-phosphoshikimate 1-carboxyvinyltransferase